MRSKKPSVSTEMASYLSYRNVLLTNSTVIASTLNAGSVSYSTLTGSTMSTRAVTVSTLTGSTITISTLSGSTINVSTLSGSTINVSTLTGSTIQATTVFFSTMTASTILTAGSTINLARNVNVPNRFVEIGCDLADSMYLDFHSKDSTLPDYSTRIISQGGATTGTGALNMYASTMGIMATNGVGIGTTVPSSSLHIKNATSAMRITGNLTNTSTRPAATTTPGAFEIRGSGAYDGSDDGFLRLSAGGGTTTSAQAYIDLSGYSTVADMFENIVLGTQGVERMRITSGGNVGIGTTAPSSLLHIIDSATAAYSYPLTMMAPNLTVGGDQYILFGKSASTANQVQLGFHYVGIGSTANYAFIQNYGISNCMCWTAGGSVGIGVTNPTYLLTVGQTVYPSSNTVGTTTIQTYGNINLYRNRLIFSNGVNDYNHTIYNNYANLDNEGSFDGFKYNGNNGHWFRVGNAALGTVPTTGMFINSTGNVGIGITNPAQPLHVYTSNPSNPGILTLEQASTNPNYISFRSNGLTCAYIGLENNSGSGLFGSGTGYGLSMGTGANGGGLVAFSVLGYIRMTVGTVATAPYVDNTYACGYGTNRWTYVYAVNGTIQTSDPCRKVITPLPYGLEELLQVNPIKYKWKDEFVPRPSQCDIDNDVLGAYQDMSSFEYYGVNADEVHCIFPELVYHENQNNDKGLNYGELVPVCINAIKELHAMNLTQADKITALEASNVALSSQIADLIARLNAAGI